MLSAFQYAYLNKILRQDLERKIYKMYGKSESNTYSNRVPVPDEPKREHT